MLGNLRSSLRKSVHFSTRFDIDVRCSALHHHVQLLSAFVLSPRNNLICDIAVRIIILGILPRKPLFGTSRDIH